MCWNERKTEEEISKTVRDVSQSKKHITILVAHRLSTIMHADKIFVLEFRLFFLDRSKTTSPCASMSSITIIFCGNPILFSLLGTSSLVNNLVLAILMTFLTIF